MALTGTIAGAFVVNGRRPAFGTDPPGASGRARPGRLRRGRILDEAANVTGLVLQNCGHRVTEE
jgi:hypothetical protein